MENGIKLSPQMDEIASGALAHRRQPLLDDRPACFGEMHAYRPFCPSLRSFALRLTPTRLASAATGISPASMLRMRGGISPPLPFAAFFRAPAHAYAAR